MGKVFLDARRGTVDEGPGLVPNKYHRPCPFSRGGGVRYEFLPHPRTCDATRSRFPPLPFIPWEEVEVRVADTHRSVGPWAMVRDAPGWERKVSHGDQQANQPGTENTLPPRREDT